MQHRLLNSHLHYYKNLCMWPLSVFVLAEVLSDPKLWFIADHFVRVLFIITTLVPKQGPANFTVPSVIQCRPCTPHWILWPRPSDALNTTTGKKMFHDWKSLFRVERLPERCAAEGYGTKAVLPWVLLWFMSCLTGKRTVYFGSQGKIKLVLDKKLEGNSFKDQWPNIIIWYPSRVRVFQWRGKSEGLRCWQLSVHVLLKGLFRLCILNSTFSCLVLQCLH